MPGDLSNYDVPTLLRTLAHAEKVLGVQVTIRRSAPLVEQDSTRTTHEDVQVQAGREAKPALQPTLSAIPELQEDDGILYPFGDLAKFQRKYHLTDEQWLRKYGYLQKEEEQSESTDDSLEKTKAKPVSLKSINTWDVPTGTIDVTRPGTADTGDSVSATPTTKDLPHTAHEGATPSPRNMTFTPTDNYYAQIPLAMRHALDQMNNTKKGNLDAPFDAEKDNH